MVLKNNNRWTIFQWIDVQHGIPAACKTLISTWYEAKILIKITVHKCIIIIVCSYSPSSQIPILAWPRILPKRIEQCCEESHCPPTFPTPPHLLPITFPLPQKMQQPIWSTCRELVSLTSGQLSWSHGGQLRNARRPSAACTHTAASNTKVSRMFRSWKSEGDKERTIL